MRSMNKGATIVPPILKNMKKKNFSKPGKWMGIMLCALALLPAGCSNDSASDDGKSDGRIALQVSGGVSVQTRAHDNAWNADDQIGIYMFTAGTSTIAEGTDNIPYKLADATTGKFAPAATAIYFPINGSNVDFHAWYPYKDVADGEWTADLTDQSSQADLDLMTADAKSDTAEGKNIYNKDNFAVALNFHHRLTKLMLNIAPGNDISADDLKGLKVELTQQWKTVIYNPRFDAPDYTEELTAITLLTTADGTSAEAILFPDDLTGKALTTGRQLVFTLKGTSETFRWNIPTGKSFNAGDKNIYTITINRSTLSVTATISDWNQGNGAGESGSAE